MLSFGRTALLALLSLSALGAVGCNAGVKTAVGPQGAHIITCGTGMKQCIAKAQSICGDDGYHILEGVVMPRVLGGSSSAYKTRTEIAEMTIRCGLPDPEEEQAKEASYKLPPRADSDLPPEEPIGTKQDAAPIPAPAAASVCTPGATQQCVGPGACQGGQICLESGAGYGACDCGGAGPSSSIDKSGATQDPAVDVPGGAPQPSPLSK